MRLWDIIRTFLEIALCALSAFLLFLSFPYADRPFLAWVAFVPWFAAIQGRTRRRAFLLSMLTGILFWGATVYWLMHVTLGGMIGMAVYLALYFAVFGLVFSTTRTRLSVIKLLFIPSVWVLLEFLRSHLMTGFPWALAAYTQTSQLAVIQFADITGAWGVSFLVLMVNVCVYGAVSQIAGEKRLSAASVIITALVLALCLGYGAMRLAERPRGAGYKVALIQGNVEHERKWLPEARRQIMETHLRLSKEAVSGGADLIVWSEAALPVILEDDPEYFAQTRAAIKDGKIPLLLGAITHRDEKFYNSALLLMPSGEVTATYDKTHLVPFGEYIPLRNVFTFLETLAPIGELARGKDFTVFSVTGKDGVRVPFSSLICFEDTFPEIARRFVNKGAAFLVNITNDAWYRYSPATYQHCQAAVFRAVENRVPVVRCANTGVSCFIDRSGRISGIVRDTGGKELFIEGMSAETVAVETDHSPTVYGLYGDYFLAFCWLIVLLGSIFYFFDRI
ncbi:MAG: apolipoprotein N-acyltransferase [Deltaproteobacteria bacterium]